MKQPIYPRNIIRLLKSALMRDHKIFDGCDTDNYRRGSEDSLASVTVASSESDRRRTFSGNETNPDQI